ncbi:hypothetical protein RB595_007527 [Gaeumannomyces hyphopodioides]
MQPHNRCHWLLAAAATLMSHAAARANGSCDGRAPAFILAGDSTTAVQSALGGGWGTGFLSFLRRPGWGSNHGRNGATTASFVEDGEWGRVIQQVKDYKVAYDCIVTIQFGHNDQIPSRGVSQQQYRDNLENFAQQVKAAGGTPIILSPLARRVFASEHEATDTLVNERRLSMAAAASTQTRFLDLNAASMAYIEAIGSTAAHRLDSKPGDAEHVGDHGSVVFGRMVADLMLGHEPVVGGASAAEDADHDDAFGAYDDDGVLVKQSADLQDVDGGVDGPAPLPECLKEWFNEDKELSDKIWSGIEA